jgi:hypothetical protein
VKPLGPFAEPYVEACRAARLRRRPEVLGQDAGRLERGDYYAYRDMVPPAAGTVRVALLAEPRTVVIGGDRMWWVPRLDQLLERLAAALGRRSNGGPAHVREVIGRMLAERLRVADRSWEEVALELMVEQETAGR